MPQTRLLSVSGGQPASAGQVDTSAQDAQLAALRSQIGQLQGASGIGAASQLSQLTAQYNSLLNQRNRARATAQQAATTAAANNQNIQAQRQAEQARQQIMDTARGGVSRLTNDPTDQLLRQYLQGQMGAQVLDPNSVPFQEGAPQFTARGYDPATATAERYSPTTAMAQQGMAFTYDPQAMQAREVSYQDPFDDQTRQAMVNEQAAGAGAAESARNQLIRDAVLASGGNAFDPSLAAAQAESMSERNRAIANARNQVNIVANRENAATRNAAALANAQFGQQANQFNTTAQNQAGQFNAAAQQQGSFNNAQLAQQAGQFNAAAQNQASQFGAGAQNQANQFNAAAQNQAGQFGAASQNQAGMFNVGNQMQAQNANFNAANQARMYNQGIQSGAAGQLGAYNNQRQGMISDAEGRLINVTGQQVFRGAEAPLQTQQTNIQLPTFQQYSGNISSGVTYAPGYFNSAIPQAAARGTYANPSGTSSVWAGSGTRPQGSGTTTINFQSGYTGTPWNQQASQYVRQQPQQPQLPQQPPSVWAGGGTQAPIPGVKQPIYYANTYN